LEKLLRPPLAQKTFMREKKWSQMRFGAPALKDALFAFLKIGFMVISRFGSLR